MTQSEFDPRALKSNRELRMYLTWLENELRLNREKDIAEAVAQASKLASGSTSEFFHESERALAMVRRESSVFSLRQLDDMSAVIRQIEKAFGGIGGA